MQTATEDSRICLVVSAGSSDTQAAEIQLAEAAANLNLQVRSPVDLLEPGMDIAASIIARLRDADVVVVLVDGHDSPNLWFETGVAVAFQRPLVVLRTAGDARLPFNIRTSLTVGPVLSVRAIELALRRALKEIEKVARPAGATGSPLGATADVLLDSLETETSLHANGSTGEFFETWFASVLGAAHVPFDRGSIAGEKDLPRAFARIDYVVTADELEGNLGSTLPVELIIGQSFSAVLPPRLSTYATYLGATGASTLLLVSLRPLDAPELVSVPGGTIVACDARDLISRMREKTFGQAVLDLRNEAAHPPPRS